MKILFSAVVGYFVAKYFGLEIGFQVFGRGDPGNAGALGYPLTFVVAMIAAGLFLWPMAELINNFLFKKKVCLE